MYKAQIRTGQKGLVVLLLLLAAAFSMPAFAQQATLSISAPQAYVATHGVNTFLDFIIELDNPTLSPVNDISFTVFMPDDVSVGNVDNECTESSDGTTRSISCEIPTLDDGASKIIDFFIDGPSSFEAGPNFNLSLSASNITIIEPNAFTASLADGDESVSGSNITIHVIRDLNLDINQNMISDIDETILNPVSGTPLEEILATQASIDLLFLYTPAAADYLAGSLEQKVSQYLTATNQIFQDNDVYLRFNAVGLEEIDYLGADTSTDQTLTAFETQSDLVFASVDGLVQSSGADLVVLLHALDSGSGGECTAATINGIGRQGDFQREYHQGRLLSVVNVGPDCLAFRSLATSMAANMGIVSDRVNVPDGGTFSFSAGYELSDVFSTLMVGEGGQPAPTAPGLDRFSNPAAICNNNACGIDREDIAEGADAVNSLNRTRHVVSKLSDTVFNIGALQKETLIGVDGSAVSITQSTSNSGAIVSDFAEFGVTINNTTTDTLHDLSIAISHLDNGALSAEAQTYRVTSDICSILGPDLATVGTIVEGATEKTGQIECIIGQLNPLQEVFFSYSVQIDDTPPILDTENYYHQLVSVNNIFKLESEACIPVFTDIVAAQAGSSVCSDVEDLPLDVVGIEGEIDLEALPSVTGSTISIPFLRIYDGQLISAEFEISNFTPLQLQLSSYQLLDSELLPTVESGFAEDGALSLLELDIGGTVYTIDATYQDDSDPALFDNLVITPI